MEPWMKCQECDKPLTKETTVRVVLDKDAFADPKTARWQVCVYLHAPCAKLLFPPRP